VDVEKKTALNSLSALKETLLTREQKICQLEADLKIESEWRQRLQTTSEADKEALYQQKVEMTHLQTIGKDFEKLRLTEETLRTETAEDAKTIAELAEQLSKAKLEIDGLKEEKQKNNPTGMTWKSNSEVMDCTICSNEFSISRRKHHCRHCGGIFCDPCSDNKFPLASSSKPVRVCDNCYTILLNKMATKN